MASSGGTEDRPAAAPPAWGDDADEVLVEGVGTALMALAVLALGRLLISWLWSSGKKDKERDEDEDGSSERATKDCH